MQSEDVNKKMAQHPTFSAQSAETPKREDLA
jgi:hypothetical protein